MLVNHMCFVLVKLATTSAAVTEKPVLSEDTNFDDESTGVN